MEISISRDVYVEAWWPNGKASVFGTEDCGFESRLGRSNIFAVEGVVVVGVVLRASAWLCAVASCFGAGARTACLGRHSVQHGSLGGTATGDCGVLVRPSWMMEVRVGTRGMYLPP